MSGRALVSCQALGQSGTVPLAVQVEELRVLRSLALKHGLAPRWAETVVKNALDIARGIGTVRPTFL